MNLRWIPLLLLLAGCAASGGDKSLPAHVLTAKELPTFSDDGNLAGLERALDRQLAAFRSEPRRSGIVIGGTRYSTDRLVDSVERFRRLVKNGRACLGGAPGALARRRCFSRFTRRIGEQFHVIEVPSPLFTAYYTPTINVSVKPGDGYRFPIYGVPDKPSQRHYSRTQIDFEGALRGSGATLFYARDRFDLYVLQIEGGGRVLVHKNGHRYIRYLLYQADNGLPFRQIDRYMLRHGMITPQHCSRFDQRRYLESHPDQARKVYGYCPGYVFFRVSRSPPTGSGGTVLTAGRSLATDPAYYPVQGAIMYVVTRVPRMPPPGTPLDSNPWVTHKTLHHFFIDQDSGHFIEGPGRADLFFGTGGYAEFLANNLRGRGRLYLLISK